MSVPQSALRYTVVEYLARERASEDRHELLDGLIYAMAGESPEHGTICTNLVAELWNQLKGTPCQVFSKDMKVKSGPTQPPHRVTKDLFSYPDLLVVCGPPEFLDEHRDVLTNPSVIIEVLSPSTEAFDRGEKFRRYRSHNPSLTDYLVVAQDQPLVEHFARPDDRWVIAASASGLSTSVPLASIGCVLRLDVVYDRIVFATNSATGGDGEAHR